LAQLTDLAAKVAGFPSGFPWRCFRSAGLPSGFPWRSFGSVGSSAGPGSFRASPSLSRLAFPQPGFQLLRRLAESLGRLHVTGSFEILGPLTHLFDSGLTALPHGCTGPFALLLELAELLFHFLRLLGDFVGLVFLAFLAKRPGPLAEFSEPAAEFPLLEHSAPLPQSPRAFGASPLTASPSPAPGLHLFSKLVLKSLGLGAQLPGSGEIASSFQPIGVLAEFLNLRPDASQLSSRSRSPLSRLSCPAIASRAAPFRRGSPENRSSHAQDNSSHTPSQQRLPSHPFSSSSEEPAFHPGRLFILLPTPFK